MFELLVAIVACNVPPRIEIPQRFFLNDADTPFENCDECKTTISGKRYSSIHYSESFWLYITNYSMCDIFSEIHLKNDCLLNVDINKLIHDGTKNDEEICKEMYDICKTNYLAIGGGIIGVGVLGGGGYYAYSKFVAKGITSEGNTQFSPFN